jgi:hypothetical protein
MITEVVVYAEVEPGVILLTNTRHDIYTIEM